MPIHTPERRRPVRVAEPDAAAPGHGQPSFVRFEIASRLACATSAMIPTVRSLASGRSTAANLTPMSRSVSRKAAFFDSRSSLRTPASPR